MIIHEAHRRMDDVDGTSSETRLGLGDSAGDRQSGRGDAADDRSGGEGRLDTGDHCPRCHGARGSWVIRQMLPRSPHGNKLWCKDTW